MARLEQRFRRFLGDETASLSVEMVLIFPMLIWAFLSVYTVFDVFRARSLALKGNYAISDLLSRETNSIDSDYLSGIEDVFAYLTQGGSDVWIRVTQVYCDQDCSADDTRRLRVDWSRATGDHETFDNEDIEEELGNKIPLIAYGERAIVVQTSMDYTPPFIPPMLKTVSTETSDSGWGFMKDQTFFDTIITEPRFGPQLCWSGENGCP